MGDHVALCVDRHVQAAERSGVSGREGVHGVIPCLPASSKGSSMKVRQREGTSIDFEEEERLIQMVECRICQDEDYIDKLESPCSCSGSLKVVIIRHSCIKEPRYAHRSCVQQWCNEKGNTTCEICQQPYQPGYTSLPRSLPDETTIDISEGWTLTGAPFDLHDPRILAMVAAQRHFLDTEYDDYAATDASRAAFCRSAALILLALLLLRHALSFSNGDGEDDASAYFSLFLLRAAGFLLPCYIMAWAISILQRRRQRQEAAATEVAFILQSRNGSSL